MTATKISGGGASPFRSLQVQLWLIFWCYATLVNAFYALIYEDFFVLRYPAFYLQCLLSIIFIKHFLDVDTRALHVIYYGTAASLGMQALVYAASGYEAVGRETLLFSNPNQLGFYGLLALSMLTYLQVKIKANIFIFLSAVACGVLLVLLSLSKAAILSTVTLLGMLFWYYPMQSRFSWILKVSVAVVIVGCAAYMYSRTSADIELFQTVVERLSRIGQSQDDSFQGRGYIRMWLYPAYMFLGAGEGLFERFEYPREIHSLFGTVLFSYGLIGFSLLAAALIFVFSRAPKDFIVFFGPILLYSLTHHPLRQLMLWVFLVLMEHVSSRTTTEFPRLNSS